MITLYLPTETAFTTNGLGNLSDAISCVVTEERNGSFELEMEYPEEGIHFHDICLRSIIKVKSNPYDEAQLFRVYYISTPLNGRVTIEAAHISYDLSGIVCSPFSAENLGQALDYLTQYASTPCPFTFSTTKNVGSPMNVKIPSSIRSLLGGSSGSLLDLYGGELEFNNFHVTLFNKRGSDNGVLISYGKNLTDLKQEANCESVYTGVYPYWYSDDDGLVALPEKILNAEGTYDFTRILSYDTSEHFTEKPTEEQLRNYATSYMKNNHIGVPKVSLDVSFIPLSQCSEYEKYSVLEQVRLCDTVTVRFEKFKIDATAKCVKTVYDALTNKYKSVTLGSTSGSLSDTIASQSEIINNTKSALETDIEHATRLITGNLGGYVVMHSSTGDTKQPDEILIMDQPSIQTASKVWRWNKSGLGYSSTGYNGPYGLAMTADGQIVANYISSGTMYANRIKGGTLTLGGAENTSGILLITDASGNQIGKWDKDGIVLDSASSTKIAKDSVTSNFIKGLNLEVGDEITMGPNATISWSNVSNHPDYVTGAQATQITKDTVTTSYVNALNITAANAITANSVSAENIKGSIMTGIIVTGARVSANGVEVFGDNGIGVPYVDFHWQGAQDDYTARICEQSQGKLVAYNSISNASDERLKKNIVNLDDRYLELIDKISPKQYRYIHGDELLNLGFIAQDVDSAMDEIGITDKAIIARDETEEGYYSLDYNQMVPILWRKIQLMQEEIDSLKDK